MDESKPAGSLRRGWTTGACATAAAKAAYWAWQTGDYPESVEIMLPGGARTARRGPGAASEIDGAASLSPRMRIDPSLAPVAIVGRLPDADSPMTRAG